MSESPDSVIQGTSDRSAGGIQTALRFLRLMRRRVGLVIASVVVTALYGGFYYCTTERVYQGKSTILITQTGPDVWNTALGASGGASSGLAPTCERLLTSDIVLEGAAQRIAELPADLRVDFNSCSYQDWTKVLRGGLSTKISGQTNLIEVNYISKAPAAARAIIDMINTSFVAFMDKNHRDSSLESVALLDRERKEIEQQLLRKQQQLREIKMRVHDLGLNENGKIVHPALQRVLHLNETLVEVQKKKIQLEASLAALRVALENGTDLHSHVMAIEPLLGKQIVMGAMGLSSETDQDLKAVQQKLIDAKTQLTTLQSFYGDRHPKISELRTAIRNTQQYLAAHQASQSEPLANSAKLKTVLLSLMQERLVQASSEEKQLKTEYATVEAEAIKLNDEVVELQIATDELNRLRMVHKSLLDKITSIDITQNRSSIQLSVVNHPEASNVPVSPKLRQLVMLCLISGLGFGAGLVYVLDLLDDRFRSPEELQQQLNLPILALVRRLPALPGTGAEAIHVHMTPQAVETEAFRTLRTTLAFAGHRRIAITSAEPGDGKTTVLINLAASLAQAGKRTLLIDGDLRRPRLSQLFEMRGIQGVSQLLRLDGDIDEQATRYIRPSGVPNLDILPSGYRLTNPGELVSSLRMEQLIAWAEGLYDQVLIDCPPILAASDAAVLGRQTDGVMVVVQPAKNRRRNVFRAMDEMPRMKVNVLGVVVNCVDERGGEYDGYGYGYSYKYDEQQAVEEGDEIIDPSLKIDKKAPMGQGHRAA